MPRKRTFTVYCPPPSGKRIVYFPLSFVVLDRLVSVSTEVTSTRAPAIGFPSGPVIVPVMISVVLPTWAWAAEPRPIIAMMTSALSDAKRIHDLERDIRGMAAHLRHGVLDAPDRHCRGRQSHVRRAP